MKAENRRSFTITGAAICLAASIYFLTGCAAGGAPETTESKDASADARAPGDTESIPGEGAGHEELPGLEYIGDTGLEFADCFSISNYKGGYSLIKDMDGRRYLVCPEGEGRPNGLDSDIRILKCPVKNIYIGGSASMDPFAAMGCLDNVAFCCYPAQEWSVEGVKEAMESGRMEYAGKYREPDYELLLSKGCGLAVVNTMIFHAPEAMEKLEELGIPVLVDYASREDTPMGRVEWIKLYGVLTGKQDKARELYDEQAALARPRPDTGKSVAFFQIDNDGTVSVRRSDDYIAEMIRLAGGRYIFTEDPDESALSTRTIQMEEFYSKALDADYVIYNGLVYGELQSLDDMLKKNSLLADLKAVKEGHVYTVDHDFYQNTMSLGNMISDMSLMLEDAGEGYVYLRKLE